MNQMQEKHIPHLLPSGLSLLEHSKAHDELYEHELKRIFGDCIKLDSSIQQREEQIEKEIDEVFGFGINSSQANEMSEFHVDIPTNSESENSAVSLEVEEIPEERKEVELEKETFFETEEMTQSEIQEEELEGKNETTEEVSFEAGAQEEVQKNVQVEMQNSETAEEVSEQLQPEKQEEVQGYIEEKENQLEEETNVQEVSLSKEEKSMPADKKKETMCNTLVDLILSKTLGTKKQFDAYLLENNIVYQKKKAFKDAHEAIKASKLEVPNPDTHDKMKMAKLFKGIFKFPSK